MPDLMELCSKIILEHLSIDTAIRKLEVVEKYYTPKLKGRIISNIKRNIEDV